MTVKQALATIWNDCLRLVLMSSAVAVAALPAAVLSYLGITAAAIVWLVIVMSPLAAATLRSADALLRGEGCGLKRFTRSVRQQARTAIAWSALPGALVIAIVLVLDVAESVAAARPMVLPVLLVLGVALVAVALAASWALCLRVLAGLGGLAGWRVAAFHLVDRPVVSAGQLSAVVLSVIVVGAVPATAVIVPGILAVLTAYAARHINITISVEGEYE